MRTQAKSGWQSRAATTPHPSFSRCCHILRAKRIPEACHEDCQSRRIPGCPPRENARKYLCPRPRRLRLPNTFAQNIRKELQDSSDAALLAATGFRLAMQAGPNRAKARDPRHPTSNARRRSTPIPPRRATAYAGERDGIVLTDQQRARRNRGPRDIGSTISEGRPTSRRATPASPPLPRPRRVPRRRLFRLLRARRRKSTERLGTARRYAKDALRLSPVPTGGRDNDERFYMSHMVLGMVAMRVDGNIREARNELLAASAAKTGQTSSIHSRSSSPPSSSGTAAPPNAKP